ncbi:MAG: pseudouridine synthase [Beijerinckiaceae bacterium]
MTDRSENNQPAETPEGERIAKVMARAGLCSRRDAERWIAGGRVSVNGTVLESPAFNVTAADRITVDGRPIARRERTRLFLFHKPRGTVTTDHDPEGRETIFDVLPEGLPRLVTVGRLDINTEGLLLLTNDGGLARVLELPATGWLRRYRVRAHGEIDQAQLDALVEGVVIEGVEYRGIEAKIDRVQGANVWLTMGLREGKNREIKRVLEHLGLAVNRLIRISFGPFQLGELEEGAIEEVKTRILKDQLGDKLATEAGADFEAPVLDTKERGKIARRHGLDERPSRDRDERAGERFPRRAPGNGGRRNERADRDERPLSARDVVHKRKHVSVIRAEKAERSDGRRRIERSETADRRGRAVPVERVSGGDRDDSRSAGRNARRFARERDGGGGERRGGERTLRRRGEEQGSKAPSREGRGGWRRSEDGADRSGREERRPRAEGAERRWEPRGERAERRERPEGGRRFERNERPERAERPPRRFRGERPDRGGGAERPPRRDFGDRPPRKGFGERSPGSRDDEGASGRAGGPDRARQGHPGKSFSGRPSGGKPGGRAGGFAGKGAGEGGRNGAARSGGFKGAGKGPSGKGGPGGKPGGGRPGGKSGGRPGGGRPGGSRPPR